MGLDHLWAGWRSAYIEAVTGDRTPLDPDATGSMFERILRLDDGDGYVVHRGERCAVILNAYPYTNGHMLVMPNRAEARLDGLDEAETLELWTLVSKAIVALEQGYECQGVNVGINLGAAAGAGVPDHLHVHVLPRWSADSNFMTAVAETRVLPESLADSWRRLRDAWPT